MTSHGYLYRIVTRHTESLEVWPPAVPRFRPEPAPDTPDTPSAPPSRPRPPVAPAAADGADESNTEDPTRASRARGRDQGRSADSTSDPADSTAMPRGSGEPLEESTSRDAAAANTPDADEGREPAGRDSDSIRAAGDRQSFNAGRDRYGRRAQHRRGDMAALRGRSLEQRAAADTVHVHIGRIEVRAVTAAAERPVAPQPPSRGPQPLSLDQYLAGRSRR